jgi:hypothetical protein
MVKYERDKGWEERRRRMKDKKDTTRLFILV